MRQGAAQHLQAVGGCQADGGGLALAIGRGGRYAIDQQSDAAHAKGRPGAKAADGDLQILGIVLAFEDGQARGADQRFGQINLRATALNGLAVDTLDSGGGIKTAHFRA